MKTVGVQLNKLTNNIMETMDKINSREKFLNTNLDPLLIEYRAVQVHMFFIQPFSLQRIIPKLFGDGFILIQHDDYISFSTFCTESNFSLNGIF